METIVKEIELNIIEKALLNYYNKTSKHLFLKDNKFFYKVLTININDDLFAFTITFNGDLCKTNVYKINNMTFDYSVRMLIEEGKFESAMKVAIHELKNIHIFPNYDGKKISIKNFKAMKEKMEEVTKYIQENYTIENLKSIQEGIANILKNIEIKK